MVSDRIDSLLAQLDALPRVGLFEEPSPVTALPELAAELGLGWLGLKRDDLLGGLHGGSKVRKLDYLLATPAMAEAPRWASAGAIGSGHLVAVTTAAAQLGHELEAHVFWQPPEGRVLENLAGVASGPTRLVYHRSRLGLAFWAPRVTAGIGRRGVIPPGGTTGAGMAGLVRAGLELAVQVRAGELPAPDRVYVPLGTAGTTAGLLLGLGLAGLRPTVHAVAVVERWLTGHRTVLRRVCTARRWLEAQGVSLPEVELPELRVDFTQLGRGYGVSSPASLDACERLAASGAAVEPIYSGKTLAHLLAGPPRGEAVLFWLTPHAGCVPAAPDWRERLPGALRRRLEAGPGPRLTRRRALVVGGAALVGLGAWVRLGRYPDLPGWRGRHLSEAQAWVVLAAAEVVLPPGTDRAALEQVPAGVDAYLTTLPPRTLREVEGLLLAVEQGTPLAGYASRFSALDPPDRERYLQGLAVAGGLRRQVYQGLRDLCLLAYYQQPGSWGPLGYGGPWIPAERRPDRYDAFRAAPDALPRGYEVA